MTTVFLTRAEYDLLISMMPEWMEKNWLTFQTRWNVNGVRVTGMFCEMSIIRETLGRE